MLKKSPILAVAITTVLTLGYSTVASADMFVSGSGKHQHIVITGLTAGDTYTLQYTDKHSNSKTMTKAARNCGGSGQIVIDEARKYKTFSLDGESLNYNDVRSMPGCVATMPSVLTESEAPP
jgi:hypothetical protein